jgi:hypothetical protein
MSKSLTSNLTASPKNNGKRRAEARLAGAFRKAVAELNRCYERSCQDEKRIGAVLRELGQALRQCHGKRL